MDVEKSHLFIIFFMHKFDLFSFFFHFLDKFPFVKLYYKLKKLFCQIVNAVKTSQHSTQECLHSRRVSALKTHSLSYKRTLCLIGKNLFTLYPLNLVGFHIPITSFRKIHFSSFQCNHFGSNFFFMARHDFRNA